MSKYGDQFSEFEAFSYSKIVLQHLISLWD